MKQINFLLALFAITISSYGQTKVQTLDIVWPAEYKWKTVSSLDNRKSSLLEMIPEKDNANNWSMFGTMMQLKEVKITSTNKVVETYKESSRKESPRAKLTILEQNDTAVNKFVVFKIETESFPDDIKPESQLYYAVQGESTLFVNFIAVKEKELSEDFTDKWTAIFKAGQFVYKDEAELKADKSKSDKTDKKGKSDKTAKTAE